jgi:hypothetical protein
MVKLEMNAQARAVRVSIRCVHGVATTAIMNTIKKLLA